MDIKIQNLKQKLSYLFKESESKAVQELLKKKCDSQELFRVLAKEIVKPKVTEVVGGLFSDVLLLILEEAFKDQDFSEGKFEWKCVALSKLVAQHASIKRFAYETFKRDEDKIFWKSAPSGHKTKRQKVESSKPSNLDVIKACYRFLKSDVVLFKDLWKWSDFFGAYWNQGCDLQKLYCCRILALLTGASQSQLSQLTKASGVPLETLVLNHEETAFECPDFKTEEETTLQVSTDKYINVEGIFLPVLQQVQIQSEPCMVKSTRANLRSLALAIACDKPVCLSGPVGCGKTMLIEYLAKKTGRLVEFQEDEPEEDEKSGSKRKKKTKPAVPRTNEADSNAFLRIQLGDQTDSKTLLGQYRCTDVPGEFVWQPGVLTQAVMSGCWILLEDLSSATQDVCTVLTGLLENNHLTVPGFRDCLKVEPGFQLFFTLRPHSGSGQHQPYSLLEKYLHTVNVLPLSRDELCTIISEKHANLATISTRIVDIFLKFSSGGHYDNDVDLEEADLRVKRSSPSEELPCSTKISVEEISRSGRLISTRDLFKLCKRSNATFNVSSAECAFLVFQNAVDLFCSHLIQGRTRTNLITEIGAKLGIIQSRCEFLADESKPDVEITSACIKVGRARLSRSEGTKKARMEAKSEPVFSFTRIAACILERIAISVAQNEPVLLIGETGVGKTSSIQFLAQKMHRRLVVVNLNNQSDVSDLIGGYKPVDLSFVLTPLRSEFEGLFRQTFDVEKNEKFLANVSTCFNRGDHHVLVKLMLKIVDPAIGKSSQDLAEKWRTFNVKLQKLNRQLNDNTNICFAYIKGSLVNCIQNGDWILLDEINLASTETLEYLSTILEPNGSIVLVEKGDYRPVERSPHFRIFACMNPSTDVGKKDLPQGIRNRFTELFVDELVLESDLKILIQDYLSRCGMQQSKVAQAVKLYKKLRAMSQLELNDGLGNRPTYSLRQLCRALHICAKNLCGSAERNLYEGFCLSFLTQLDQISREKVLQLIQTTLLSNSKAVLSYKIPKPADDFINFEGYWIQQGSNEVQPCEEYILTESVRKNLQDLARIISIGKLPILLQGPTSAGKTSLINYIAKRSGNTCVRINNHEHTDITEYVGTYVADVTGKLVFMEGVLVQAMRNGFWIILDELNLASSDILEALNRVLDDNRELYIPETQTVVRAHPNFMLFATQNPPGLYGGRKTLSRAFKNRFVELHFVDIPKSELETILEKRCLIPKSYAGKMVKTMSELQMNRQSAAKSMFTLRDLFRWGNRYTFADKSLLADSKYDWNQHLIDEGFLVLSSRVRSDFESDIIQSALFTHFRKKVDLDLLFTLTETTSAVTRPILERLEQHKGSVVWTFNMRRMAVLTAKALEFREPVLLVGPTGCGKTTICQILAQIEAKTLRILNCHLHTESADFLGGLRPFRGDSKDSDQLFEWSDGPLIHSMQEGGFFLADEISLSEDSVLERLNCLLEPERTLLLAEKATTEEIDSSSYTIVAQEGFQFLATMNPGGDFGKKELSPALRNRFTEIWCRPADRRDDLVRIAEQSLEIGEKEKLAEVVIDVSLYLKKLVEKIVFSVRDILAWCSYLTKNAAVPGALSLGLHTIFLDAFDMLAYEPNEIETFKRQASEFLAKKVRQMGLEGSALTSPVGSLKEVESSASQFGISPFFVPKTESSLQNPDFLFSAPTTKENLFRLLSAFSLDKAILLEGPPGVGKTSLVENLASAVGFRVVRINLCEQTDLADLFGTDLPSEDDKVGSFVWRDGPLLSSLKARNTWILLDELNLAPQSVLEGLNGILDHRGEVFIPELNKTFKLGEKTRIFATQNPLKQGGGRKGLPQSFLNRFTKVYLKKLERQDLLFVVRGKADFEQVNRVLEFDLSERMVMFSEKLEEGFARLECGYKGGPFEANLRDIMRWLEFFLRSTSKRAYSKEKLLEVLFEKARLVYVERMRTDQDKAYIVGIFSQVFETDGNRLFDRSEQHALYWTDSHVFINDLVVEKKALDFAGKQASPLLLDSEVGPLKSLIECAELRKPLILCGPSNCGKTKIIDALAAMRDLNLVVDTIEDSVTGSFQQFDFNRHLEQISQESEGIYHTTVNQLVLKSLKKGSSGKPFTLMASWEAYSAISDHQTHDLSSDNISAEEIKVFEAKAKALSEFLSHLSTYVGSSDKTRVQNLQEKTKQLLQKLENLSSLSAGNRFEWVDSQIVRAIRDGRTICLNNVNLTSAAILDRLNPVFEPNGELLISEKGDSDSSTVAKHANFQPFLTMDPRSGEISRAMRNRCIELAFVKESYSEKDLKRLIFDAGVRKLGEIHLLLSVHNRLSSVSDFSSFSVSHLLKFAFLVRTNKQLGIRVARSVIMAGLEVYVRASNVDLLGFGLPFYKQSLREALLEEVRKQPLEPSFVDFGQLCPSTSELTADSMIRMQSELFVALSKGSNSDLPRILADLSIEVPITASEVGSYFLYLLYQLSSSDVKARHDYLAQFLEDPRTQKLNEQFLSDVAEISCDLPWNTKLFPISDPKSLKEGLRRKIGNLLDIHLAVLPVEVERTNKLSKIDAISYSYAVKQKSLVDSVNSAFLVYLYDFLNGVQRAIEGEAEHISLRNLSLAVHWINRLLQMSQRGLFQNKKASQNLLDSLLLHFKWLDKHLLRHVGIRDKQFLPILETLRDFYAAQRPSAGSVKRLFVKKFTNFRPFYSEEDVETFERVQEVSKLGSVVSPTGDILEYSRYLRGFGVMMDQTYQDKRGSWFNGSSFYLKLLESASETPDCTLELFKGETFEDVQTSLKEKSVAFEVLPVLEYFALLGLCSGFSRPEASPEMNSEYFLITKSISLSNLELLKTLQSVEFKDIMKLWLAGPLAKTQSSILKGVQTRLDKLALHTLATRTILCQNLLDVEGYLEKQATFQLPTSGPVLTEIFRSVLLGTGGQIRGVGLGQLDNWRSLLTCFNQVLWSNQQFVPRNQTNDLALSQKRATYLLQQVNELNESLSDFEELVSFLKETLSSASEDTLYQKSMLDAVTGALELNLTVYLPLIDPVEKNRLKNEYCKEDIQHVEKLIFAYECMGSLLNYKFFGEEIVKDLKATLEELKQSLETLNKKVAIRPQNECYSSLVRDVSYFLGSFCSPRHFLELFRAIGDRNESVSQKVLLWLSNSSRFLQSLSDKYGGFYRDFTAPIEYALGLLRVGLSGLIDALKKEETSAVLKPFENNPKFFSLISGLDHQDYLFLQLALCKLTEVENRVKIGESMREEIYPLSELLTGFVNLWQTQEELRKKKQEEEDSLYVTKTHCKDETDEEVAAREIVEIFPTFVEDDFSDFVQRDSLEQTIKYTRSAKNFHEVLSHDQIRQICVMFIGLMKSYGQTWYYSPGRSLASRSYIEGFETRTRVYAKIFDGLKEALRSELDHSNLPSLCLMVGLAQQKYGETLFEVAERKFDFYNDSQISEVLGCAQIMDKIEVRTRKELEQWPEHAVLNDILVIISRLREIPCTSPIVRFNTGLQILRQKLDEWNSVAHRNNNMRDLEAGIAEFVHRWMRMELQYWRDCLSTTFERVKSYGYRFWFHFHAVVQEFMTSEKTSADLQSFEKYLRDFMEQSSYAQFSLRLDMLRSFELYLAQIRSSHKFRESLVAILHNSFNYYSQFQTQVEEKLKAIKAPIEKKLKEFVKIESFNKDLSYFSMKHNVSRVHRQLHKFLKEYETEIKVAAVELMAYGKDGGVSNGAQNGDSRRQVFNVDPESFLIAAPQKVKYLKKSQTLVQEAITKSSYKELLTRLEEAIEDQLETVTHLQGLEVDRTQERPKQKSQAKQILNQKRRALTDFFKLLNQFGFNHRSGLVSGKADALFDFRIKPFSLEAVSSFHQNKPVDAAMRKVGTVDAKWNKSIFKLRLLMKALLTPKEGLGPSNLERMKGFAIELFYFAQNQRRTLRKAVFEMYGLRKALHHLRTSSKGFSKDEIARQRARVVKAVEVSEQLQIILRCAPPVKNDSFSVTLGNDVSEKVLLAKDLVNTLLSKSQALFQLLKVYDEEMFCELTPKMKKISEEIEDLVARIRSLAEEMPVLSVIQDLPEPSETALMETEKGDLAELSEKLLKIVLVSIQKVFKKYEGAPEASEDLQTDHISTCLQTELESDWELLGVKRVSSVTSRLLNAASSLKEVPNPDVSPLLEQYSSLVDFFALNLLTTHKFTVKIVHALISSFLEIANKGFCIPEDLLADIQEQKQKDGQQNAGGFNLDDGEGENDVSEKIESEDQLEDARPKGEQKEEKDDGKDVKEEKGIDMSEDFDAKMQDLEKDPDDSEDEPEEDEDDLDKQMGDTEQGADRLDDQIWGSDEEKEEEEQEDEKKEEEGKGSGEKDDKHNKLDAENKLTEEQAENGEKDEGLDAAENSQQQKKPEKPDIDNMDEENAEEEQVNNVHNELEEPPKPEDFDIEENFNLDNEEGNEKEQEGEENPFDIDKMKDQTEMEETNEETNEEEPGEEESKQEPDQADSSDSEGEDQGDLKMDETQEQDNQEAPPEEEEPSDVAVPDEIDPEGTEKENKPENRIDDRHESKDKPSKEENVQQMPDSKNKGSTDQTQTEAEREEAAHQDTEIDEQDTGEDKEGIGQAENEESKEGHKGVAQSKTVQSKEELTKRQKQEKSKVGTSDERRTLDTKQNEKKKLKTVDQIDEGEDQGQEEDEAMEAEEYQHVKEASQRDKSTLDSATDDQTKQIVPEDEAEKPKVDEEQSENLELAKEAPEEPKEEQEDPEKVKAEKSGSKKDKSQRNEQTSEEQIEKMETDVEIEGETSETLSALRGTETTAHTAMEMLRDISAVEEPTALELLEMRRHLEAQLKSAGAFPDASHVELWQQIANRMLPVARELCEQLRLVLEPTKRTRFKGDYRTGRRINMKKIIPYIASQFRKDKIWLRRTKPAQRDYKITIAVDNSKSMDHNNSRTLTLEAISLVSQALTLLESGKLALMSFGEAPKIVLKHSEQFEGGKLVKALSFDENHTRIGELLDFVRVENQENSGSENSVFENLLLVLSDGRNIFSEGEQKVRNSVKLTRLQRTFIVYIILDNPENKHSILDIRIPIFSDDKKSITMHSYLDLFPFPYYIICRDLNQLPHVLSDAMRQWFELVNSDQ